MSSFTACLGLSVVASALAASGVDACPPPQVITLLQTLVCSSAQNSLKWSQYQWDPNTGGSFQLSGTTLCMQAGPSPSAGSYLALQLAPCTGGKNQQFASIQSNGVDSKWITHLDGNCLDANSGSQNPNEQMETYRAWAFTYPRLGSYAYLLPSLD